MPTPEDVQRFCDYLHSLQPMTHLVRTILVNNYFGTPRGRDAFANSWLKDHQVRFEYRHKQVMGDQDPVRAQQGLPGYTVQELFGQVLRQLAILAAWFQFVPLWEHLSPSMQSLKKIYASLEEDLRLLIEQGAQVPSDSPPQPIAPVPVEAFEAIPLLDRLLALEEF